MSASCRKAGSRWSSPYARSARRWRRLGMIPRIFCRCDGRPCLHALSFPFAPIVGLAGKRTRINFPLPSRLEVSPVIRARRWTGGVRNGSLDRVRRQPIVRQRQFEETCPPAFLLRRFPLAVAPSSLRFRRGPSGRSPSSCRFPAGRRPTSPGASSPTGWGQMWARPVVVDNQGGGNGCRPPDPAARRSRRAHDLPHLGDDQAVNPALYDKLPYDPIGDFEPITRFGTSPFVVLVRADSPIRTLADLTALLKAEPGRK